MINVLIQNDSYDRNNNRSFGTGGGGGRENKRTSSSSAFPPPKDQGQRGVLGGGLERSGREAVAWIRRPEGWDPSLAVAAFAHMRREECRLVPAGPSASTAIKSHMRAILCDWLVQVQVSNHLIPFKSLLGCYIRASTI